MLQLTETEFNRIVHYMQQYCGINLSRKKELIESRLAFELHKRGYMSYEAFFLEAMNKPESAEHQLLIDKLSTNHTYFFREQDCLRHLKECALPELLERGTTHIRVWSAACSSGQECYTVAMIIEDYLRERAPGVTYSIMGWDINNGVLETAKTGIYPKTELDTIPAAMRERYTREYDDEHFVMVPELRDKMTFSHHNLVKPFHLRQQVQVLFCRNVMIYFQAGTREALTQRLHAALSEKSYLYIGATEFIDREQRYFRFVAPSIYQKGGVGIG